MAPAQQMIRRRQPGGTGADNGDPLAGGAGVPPAPSHGAPVAGTCAPARWWSAANRCRLRIESASSTSHWRHRCSQSRGQTRPRDAGSVRSSVTISAASRWSPAAIRAMKFGMSSRAGHPVRQGPMQSPAWSESRSSRAVLRAARTSSESVITIIPSAAGMAQEGQRSGRPWIWTAHRKQEADGSNPSTWQSVGMAMPSLRAAARMVCPRSTCDRSMARCGIASAGSDEITELESASRFDCVS